MVTGVEWGCGALDFGSPELQEAVAATRPTVGANGQIGAFFTLGEHWTPSELGFTPRVDWRSRVNVVGGGGSV